jgi:hypothetical protein
MKYLVLTDAELDGLAGGLDWKNLPLDALGGKTPKDIFGANAVHDVDFWYTCKNYDDERITNPDHVDFGKVAIKVNAVDVANHVPAYVNQLVDFDPTWRVDV